MTSWQDELAELDSEAQDRIVVKLHMLIQEEKTRDAEITRFIKEKWDMALKNFNEGLLLGLWGGIIVGAMAASLLILFAQAFMGRHP